jgi:hypothetical protein
MNIPGYDAWKLSGPPEWEGPTCDYCGTGDDIRVESPAIGRSKAVLVCEECFTTPEGGHNEPCFDDLQTADDYAQEQTDMRADYLHDQARDRKGEE